MPESNILKEIPSATVKAGGIIMFNSLMHVSFYTNHWDEMMDFYLNKLGLKLKVLVHYSVYKDRNDRPEMQKIAKTDPNRIFNAYIEIAPGQFVELFPAMKNQKPHPEWNEYEGYSHFALLCNDIFKCYDEMKMKGIQPRNKPSKGPSGTWQFWIHDPDFNWFEIMQYTEDSYQVKGHVEQ